MGCTMRAAFAGLLLSSLTFALPSFESPPVVHEVANIPANFRFIAPAAESSPIQLSIALKQSGLDALRQHLDAVSHPDHADYGSAHLSHKAIAVFQQPSQGAVASVSSWLIAADITDFRADGAWVKFNTSVGKANKLLGSTFGTYEQTVDGEQELRRRGSLEVVRATEYSLPRKIADVVDFVYPVTQFISPPARREVVEMDSTPLEKRQSSSWPASCAYTTPQCIVDLYNINYFPPDGPSPTDFGIAGFLGEVPVQDTITTFLNSYSPRLRNSSDYSAAGYNFTLDAINGGGVAEPGAGVEAALDSFYSMAFIQPINVTYFSTGGRGPALTGTAPNLTLLPDSESGHEPWVEFLEDLLAREHIPHVISISYTDDEQLVPAPYARRVCDLFMQVAARGVSVLVATGDGGANGIRYGDCMSNDGVHGKRFLATFPVGCPYVTAVGATGAYLPIEPATYSSGGFSEIFGRPSWQDAAVQGYLKAINGSHNGWYNQEGRGYPDLSAIGSRFLMQPGWTQKGTSASTPVVAAMVALANDIRMRRGEQPLGFLNPLLYSDKMKGAFTDAKSGSIGSCPVGTDVELGFEAVEGWDAGTGLGTLDFARFVEALG